MKKLLFLLLPLCGVFAQTKEIKPGIYQSNTMGTDFIMRLNEDKSYELIFLHGNYTQEADTLKLDINKKQEGDFAVKPVKRDKSTTSLTITFPNTISRYMLSGLFIGLQHNDSRPPEYKSIRDLIKTDGEEDGDFGRGEPISFKVDKSKYIYLANYRNYFSGKHKDQPTVISKVEIPEDVSEVAVEYDYNKMADLDFRLYKDEKDQLVMTEGKSPITFVFTEKDGVGKDDEKLAVQVIKDTDFAKNAGLIADTDELVEETIDEEVPSYNFKYTIDKTFAEAQKTAAKSKNKFLIVAFDYENKNGQADFDKFIKRTETQVGYNMSEEYVESEDHFIFYLASDKDKNVLTKNKLDAGKPQILVFNPDGDLIYHTPSTLKKSGYFGIYNSAYDELKQANQYLKFDRSVSNKKATVPELTKAFKIVSRIERPYRNTVVDTAVVVYEPAVETVDYTADTVAVGDYSDYSRESVIGDKENLYKLKTTSETANAKWAQIIAFYKKSNTYNQDYIDTGLSELSGEGFSSVLFTDEENKSDALRFEFLDYVLAHLQEIKKAEEVFKKAEEPESHYEDNNIDSLLNSFFSEYANGEPEDKVQADKVRQYYKKYIALSGENPVSLRSYFYFIQNTLSPETEREYLEVYGKFFDSVIKPNSNVIENLDSVYSANFTDSIDWAGFKYEFASTANTVAWYAVEHKLDKDDIEKAIRWSEASLKIDSKNAYFLDTLAQLYYLNGQKQKAIDTEAQAISAASGLEEPETKLKYEEVLQQMKNGTY
jgi:hypothetical protein